MGYTLHVWTRTSTFGADVVGLVRNGVTVRFLVMDSTNPHLEALINSQQITALNLSQVKAELEGFQNQVRSIQQEIRKLSDSKGSFEFRTVKQGLTVNQICRFDDEIRVIPYLWSVVASSSPLLVIEGATTGLFKTYQAEFENLWEINGPNS